MVRCCGRQQERAVITKCIKLEQKAKVTVGWDASRRSGIPAVEDLFLKTLPPDLAQE